MGRVELLAYVRRLAGILMERLEEGSREKTLDQAQTRMLSSTSLKALRLWQEVLNGDDGSVKDLERVRTVAKTLEGTVVGSSVGGADTAAEREPRNELGNDEQPQAGREGSGEMDPDTHEHCADLEPGPPGQAEAGLGETAAGAR